MAITALDMHCRAMMLVILLAAAAANAKGQDVPAVPAQEAGTPTSPEAYSSSSSPMQTDSATTASTSAVDSIKSPNDSRSTHSTNEASSYPSDETAVDVTAAALPAKLPKDQREIILHLGFEANSQLDYGGRHITIATFKGKRDAVTGKYKAMTRGSIARWINATSKCDLNLLAFQKSITWRLNKNSCNDTKAASCSCIGHYDHKKQELQCGDKYPWPAPYGYDKPTYTVVLKSKHLNDLGRCLVALQTKLNNNRTINETALKSYGIEEMSAKGPDSTSGTPWHAMLYRAYTYPPADEQYQKLLKSTSGWRVYWNEYQFKQGDRLPAPCPDPALDDTKPAGNPGKLDKGKYVAPLCWKWTEYS